MPVKDAYVRILEKWRQIIYLHMLIQVLYINYIHKFTVGIQLRHGFIFARAKLIMSTMIVATQESGS